VKKEGIIEQRRVGASEVCRGQKIYGWFLSVRNNRRAAHGTSALGLVEGRSYGPLIKRANRPIFQSARCCDGFPAFPFCNRGLLAFYSFD